jgi:Asp-tRNA(Asn)/Glu-tRNA(Gln) amidotransferase A subunit family amidase
MVDLDAERRVSPFTAVCLTGRPALTMPLAHDPQGMPIGATLVGRHWGDEKLLAIAEALLPMTVGYRRPIESAGH